MSDSQSCKNAEPGGCPSAVTVRVTDKRLLTQRPDPCRGIVGRRVVPLSRSAPNAGLSRRDPYDVLSRLASRITGQRDLTLERETNGRREDKDSLGAPHVYLGPGSAVALVRLGTYGRASGCASPAVQTQR